MTTIPLFASYALRPLRADDAQAVFNAIDTQREYLGRWLPFVAATRHASQTQEVVARMLADSANPVFTIRSGDAFAGLIGFKSANPETRTIEIGYWLCKEHQHGGVMTTAVRTLSSLAFEQMGMQRIEIQCAINNLPSNSIPCRLGFLLDHVKLQGEQLEDGSWTDLNVYVLAKNTTENEPPRP